MADRGHERRMAQGFRQTLFALRLAADGPELVAAFEAAVLAADAIIQEAFRRDPDGDTRLLGEAKIMLRGDLGNVASRWAGHRAARGSRVGDRFDAPGPPGGCDADHPEVTAQAQAAPGERPGIFARMNAS